MPRNVDPHVADPEEVDLVNIDDLSSIADDNHEERSRVAIKAEGVVGITGSDAPYQGTSATGGGCAEGRADPSASTDA